MLISLILQLLGVAKDAKEATKIEVEDIDSFMTGRTIGYVLLILITLCALYFGIKLIRSANADAKRNKKKEISKK